MTTPPTAGSEAGGSRPVTGPVRSFDADCAAPAGAAPTGAVPGSAAPGGVAAPAVGRPGRILLLAPTGRDATLATRVLADAGLDPVGARDVHHLCSLVDADAGAVLLAQEALDRTAVGELAQALARQPAWSDLPLLVVTAPNGLHDEEQRSVELLRSHGNVTLLERPLRIATLLSTVHSALRARRRQLEIRDHIAERQRLEEAVRESESRLRAALEASGTGTFQWELSSQAMEWDANLDRLLGLAPHGPLQLRDFLQAVHLADRPVVRAEMDRCAADGCELDIEFRVVWPDGTLRWLYARGRAFPAAHGGVAGVMTGACVDITERKLAEEELARHRDHLEDLVARRTEELESSHQRLRLSERMASIGTLSAGVGHDMGNLLLPIRMRIEAMEAENAGAPLADDLAAIRNAVDYLQRLARGLRLLALDPEEGRASEQVVELEEWWHDTVRLLQNALPRGVVLEHRFDAGVPPLGIARHLLTQAVFNLVQNSGNALREQGCGTVLVWARPATADEAAAIRGVHPGAAQEAAPRQLVDAVRIGVTDDGPGMTPEVRRHCLEPFFTTRTRGLSTGLGLPLVHGVVQRQGGRLDITSAPDAGTTVAMTLPARAASQAHRERPLAIVSLGDARLASFVASVLEAFGCTVRRTPGGETDARLWVADPDRHGLAELEAFLEHDRQRYVVLLGRPPREPAQRGVVVLDQRPPPQLLRKTLQRLVLHECSAGPQ